MADLKRPIKRLLVFAGELGVFALGVVFSVAVADYLFYLDRSLAPVGFFSGLAVSILALLAVRRKTQPWKLKYDAVGWALDQAERKLHPTRAKYKRRVRRVLVWVPTIIAAAVLFFLPVATHVVYPRSRYLRHYQVPIPWNVAVFSWPTPLAGSSYVEAFASSGKCRFGLAPFWDSRQMSSEIIFGNIDPAADTFESNYRYFGSGSAGATRRDFRLGGVGFTCWQYPAYRNWTGALWLSIHCLTPVDVRQYNLYASFDGREEDVPLFYRILEGVKPIE